MWRQTRGGLMWDPDWQHDIGWCSGTRSLRSSPGWSTAKGWMLLCWMRPPMCSSSWAWRVYSTHGLFAPFWPKWCRRPLFLFASAFACVKNIYSHPKFNLLILLWQRQIGRGVQDVLNFNRMSQDDFHCFCLVSNSTYKFSVQWFKSGWSPVDPLHSLIRVEVHFHQTGIYFLHTSYPPVQYKNPFSRRWEKSKGLKGKFQRFRQKKKSANTTFFSVTFLSQISFLCFLTLLTIFRSTLFWWLEISAIGPSAAESSICSWIWTVFENASEKCFFSIFVCSLVRISHFFC